MAVPFKGFKGCPTFFTFPQKSNHQFHRIWHLSKRNIFDRCKWLLPDHVRFATKVSKILVWGMSGKEFLGNKHPDFLFNKQIYCLLDLLFLFGWLHGWQRSFVMNVLLLRKDCFRHDLGKGGAYDDGTSSSNLLFGTVYVILLMAEILRRLGCETLYTV